MSFNTQDRDYLLDSPHNQPLDSKKNEANLPLIDTDISFQQTVQDEKNQRLENFILCMQSYGAAIDLLARHLSDEEKLQLAELKPMCAAHIKQIEAIEQTKQSQDKKFDQQKQTFYQFFLQCTEHLKKYTTLSDDALTQAKNFAVFLHGVLAINTEIKLDQLFHASSQETTRVWQSDEPVVDEKLLTRLCQEVKENIRLWVENLAEWEKETIKNLNSEETQLSAALQYILPSSLRHIPGLANLFLHRLILNEGQDNPTILIEFFRHATQVPVSLFTVNKPDIDKEILVITCENIASQIRLSLQHRETKPIKNKELVILTQSLISPGPAATKKSQIFSDRSDNDTLIYDTKEKAVALFQYALEHLEEEITNTELLSTFFKSSEQSAQPYTYRQWLEKLNIILPKQEEASAPLKIRLLSTNHPYNLFRYLGTYSAQTTRNQLNTAKLFGCIGRYLSDSLTQTQNSQSPQNSGANEDLFAVLTQQLKEAEDVSVFTDRKLQIKNTLEIIITKIKKDEIHVEDKNTLRLLEALRAYLTIPPGQGSLWQRDTRHRQSMISALEVIIVDCLGGVPWMACKSGKDRTGGASAAIDAMVLFYQEHGRFPFYNDDQTKRSRYLMFLGKLLQSGHHQKVASCNAPGAKGLINEHSFLPGDMKFNYDRIKKDTEFARLNKPKVNSLYHLNKKIKNFIYRECKHLKKNTAKLFYVTQCALQEAINTIIHTALAIIKNLTQCRVKYTKIENLSTETLKHQKDSEKNYSKIEDSSTLIGHTSSNKNIDPSCAAPKESTQKIQNKGFATKNYFSFPKFFKTPQRGSENAKMTAPLLSHRGLKSAA